MRFIDLFAGIGGFRLGFEREGFECVFSCEIDDHAASMYESNFGENPKCDITTLDPAIIPEFEILLAGFPCQSFSVCGFQKGFYDTRGTLFFDICRILEEKKPKYFVLENVQNLATHDKGNTLTVMLHSLHELGYTVSYKVLNARDFGVPQNRTRIIIIGNNDGSTFDFNRLKETPVDSMIPFLDKTGEFEFLSADEYTLIPEEHIKTQKSGLRFIGYRNKKIRTTGVREGTHHLSRVHKQPNRIYSAEGIHPTIASQETSGRYWIYVDKQVRKLTLDECYRFMGFPENFKKVGPLGQQYQRVGNSICIPMVQAVAKEIKNQFLMKGDNTNMVDPMNFLNDIYIKAVGMDSVDDIGLTQEQLQNLRDIVDKEETQKGVFTVLFTSLVYKSLHPEQDIRLHQANMNGGYSGRSFDTKYVTPFLKSKQFRGAMKESGWLTRSLEQSYPYNLDYQGKISNKKVKNAFLSILNDVEKNNTDPLIFLKALIKLSVVAKSKQAVLLVNPIESESSLTIDNIILYLNKHFYYPYKTRGASILPVLAMYSIYQCVIDEIKRFDGKILDQLGSHTSSDRSSGDIGDIVVRNADGTLYEGVEVKFDIPIDHIMISDAYKKFAQTSTQRYYVLSTDSVKDDEHEKIQEIISHIKEEHGCQVIINGIFPTLRYYLRLLDNTDKFMEYYIQNLESNSEVSYELKLAWNSVTKK